MTEVQNRIELLRSEALQIATRDTAWRARADSLVREIINMKFSKEFGGQPFFRRINPELGKPAHQEHFSVAVVRRSFKLSVAYPVSGDLFELCRTLDRHLMTYPSSLSLTTEVQTDQTSYNLCLSFPQVLSSAGLHWNAMPSRAIKGGLNKKFRYLFQQRLLSSHFV